jgi:hypothetical protein
MLLLIPGPVTTRPEVRRALAQDIASWANAFRRFLTRLRGRVLRLAGGVEGQHVTSMLCRRLARCRWTLPLSRRSMLRFSPPINARKRCLALRSLSPGSIVCWAVQAMREAGRGFVERV